MLIITMSQFGSVIVPIVGIERPGIGRKRILIGSQVIYTLINALILFVSGAELFVVAISIGIIMSLTILIVIWPYTSETYPTKMRGIALSVNQIFLRLTSAVMPFVSYTLYNINPAVPIGLFTVVSVIAVIILCGTEEDKTGKPLCSDESLAKPLLS